MKAELIDIKSFYSLVHILLQHDAPIFTGYTEIVYTPIMNIYEYLKEVGTYHGNAC